MNKWAAYDMFEGMRPSTLEEQLLYEQMLENHSRKIDWSIWDMSGDIEVGYCDICYQKAQLQRKYYYYGIDCECCGSAYGHFEIVKHCKDCEPKPPKYIKAIMNPIHERD